jgi:microcystin-dependent protein
MDLTTGLGSGRLAKWALANGNTYTATDGSSVITYDMRDRVPLGAGTTYTVGQAIGAATHTLTEAELPVVSPSLTDPGHTHTHTDPGHNHTLTDPGHTHAATAAPHTHTGTTNTTGDHVHYPTSNPANTWVTSDNSGGIDVGTGAKAIVSDNDGMTTEGDHSHSLSVDNTTVAVTNSTTATGVSLASNTTGITNNTNTTGITVASFGSGDAHNNIQPSSAGLWIQRIG